MRRWLKSGRVEVRAAIAGAAAGVAVAVGAAMVGWSARLEVLVVAGAAVALVVLAMRIVFTRVDVEPWLMPRGADEYAYIPEDRVAFFERRLEICVSDARIFEARIQPVLRQLTFDALRRYHGIDPERQPGPASATAGQGLWALIVDPPLAPPTAKQLVDAIDRLERLAPT